MKKIALLDTSLATFNKGDEIIMDSARKVLSDITKDSFVITMPTHTPAFHSYQTIKMNSKVGLMENMDFKFVCGTNLLYTNMIRPWAGWNINIFNCKPLKNSILLGVGCGVNSKKINFYTRNLYRNVLSHEYIHSVRDNKAKEMLEEIGLKAINTGCPTLWSLTPDLCKQIPKSKSNSVVFTLTDYSKDKVNDQKMINIIQKCYKNIYFWPQGMGDLSYFKEFNNIEGIQVLSPSVECYSEVLGKDVDYIGTRLHAGIYAMKHRKRSIIITVDYRAREMNKTYNLNCIERQNIESALDMINSEFKTNVNVNYDSINTWINQFK